jgi:NAD(P)H dehydrogenase (quinone)
MRKKVLIRSHIFLILHWIHHKLIKFYIMNNIFRIISLSIFIFGYTTVSIFAQPVVLITYYSKTGTTQTMAEAVALGARNIEGVQVIIKTVEETTTDDLLNAGAIILGSPVYNSNIAPQMQEFISGWPFENSPLKNKLGAVFVTAGGISAGEEITMLNMIHSMMIFGMIIIGGDDWTAPFGASAIRGETPFDQEKQLDDIFLKKAEGLGERVAGILKAMND